MGDDESPTNQNPDLEQGGDIGVDEVARQTLKDTTGHVGHVSTAASDSQAAPGVAQGLTDGYGRTFDAAIHMTKRDGTPALTRGGRLMSKPGMGGAAKVKAPRPAAASPGASGSLRDQLNEAAGAKSEILPADEETRVEAAPHQLTEEEFRRRAEAGARFVRKATGKFGRWMGGEEGEYQTIDGSNEGQDIEDSTLDAQIEYQKLVPAGSLLMLAFHLGSYLARVWGSEKNTERVDELMARINGRPVKPKPRAQQEADAPAGGDDRREEQPKAQVTPGRISNTFI